VVSIVPGCLCISRKTSLVRTLLNCYGPELAFRLVPRTFKLPDELDAWAAWLAAHPQQVRTCGDRCLAFLCVRTGGAGALAGTCLSVENSCGRSTWKAKRSALALLLLSTLMHAVSVSVLATVQLSMLRASLLLLPLCTWHVGHRAVDAEEQQAAWHWAAPGAHSSSLPGLL
jgi:hypothetical protein